MELTQWIFVVLGFCATLVSAVFGFGTALLVLAMGSYLLPVKETIALATVLFTASTLTKTVVYNRHLDWQVVGLMASASLPFAYAGALLMAYAPADMLTRLLGTMILVYLALRHVKRVNAIRIGTTGLLVGSACYGFVSGLVGSGNLIKVILFREMLMSRGAFVGTMAATSVLANVVKLATYARTDVLGKALLLPMLAVVVVAPLAVLVGRSMLHSMSAAWFDRGVQIVLLVSAVGLLVSG